MKVEVDRLLSLLDYVEATERDRLPTAIDMASYRGFRRGADEIILLPGVLINVRGDDDHVWLNVERLVRLAPPLPGDAELRAWIDLADDVTIKPALRSEIPNPEVFGPEPGQEIAATLRLTDHPDRVGLEAKLAGYVREIWSAWVLEERPRRHAIDLYNGLFSLRQILDGASEQPHELVWGIGIARWERRGAKLHHPLLTVPVELAINEQTHAIEVRPRSELPPGIESDPLDYLEAPSVDDWRKSTRRYLDALEGDGLSPFAPDSFAPVLRRAVAVLDPDGHYLPDLGERRAPGGETLQVDDRWVLIQRERRATQLMSDLRQFRATIEQIDDIEALPGAVRVLLEPPAEEAAAPDYPGYRGVSTIPGITSSDGSGEDLFFPKPFNREQVEVIQRLATRPGVVVQGPPGTGKTHTIANIISHYLAQGKRVLVTSQKAPPLKVLRDKLPAAVRPLAVSLVESDRDGLRQFQESVDIIADRLQRIRPGEVGREIAALDARIEALHRGLAAIDRQVEEIGRGSMTAATIGGARVEPADAARRVVAAGDLAGWLTDSIDVIASHEPEFDDDSIARLRAARKTVGERLYALDLAPPPGTLPSVVDLLALHQDLAEAERIAQATSPADALAEGASIETIATLRAELDSLRELLHGVDDSPFAWSSAALQRWRADGDDAVLRAISGLEAEVTALVGEAHHYLVRPVQLPEGGAIEPPLREAIERLAQGEDLGLFQALFARGLKARLAAIRLSGHAPANAEEWSDVNRYLAALDQSQRLTTSWNHARHQAGLEPAGGEGLGNAEIMRRQLLHLAALRDVAARERTLQASLRRLLPGWQARLAGDRAEIDRLVLLFDRHLRRERLAAAETGRDQLLKALDGVQGSIGDELRAAVIPALGRSATDEALLAQGWSSALTEAERLRSLATHFGEIRHLASLVEESGAPHWANRLRTEPVTGVEDPLTPEDWRDRWTLRRLSTWLARIDRHEKLAALGLERHDHEERLSRTYEDSIELRTWCRLAERASDQVRTALAAYAQAVRKIGRGTGIRAGRYRQDARAAADRAKNALPCWIMPHYRVSESLPAELGLFDLVVIDEASQSTVAALPALLRAKQVLIVGDDRQVSPDAGFREEARMNLLADRHLGGQVADYRAALREEKSLYDLGTVVFAGGAILLKEHFRCVGPIIEYSKAQFYAHQLVPLRLPSASERLDPPLVDILVEDGYRKGKVNPPEVDCIVDAISRIADDPAMAHRSIGVTTLLGQEQAVAILKAIEEVLGAEVMLRHDIRVGEPAAFQGDERDIMFISLVAERGGSGLSGLAYEQRFNVAASRARDRMVLVRSVELEDLRPSDKLRRSLIEHFHAPFAGAGNLTEDRRARCESPFEREMYDLLVERGYRVDTQVPVGTKRIDLVVEGGIDSRLAIECDGDPITGPSNGPTTWRGSGCLSARAGRSGAVSPRGSCAIGRASSRNWSESSPRAASCPRPDSRCRRAASPNIAGGAARRSNASRCPMPGWCLPIRSEMPSAAPRG